MNYAQRLVVVALLSIVGATLAFVFLKFGEGAFSSMGGDRIAILVLSGQDKTSMFGSGYGLYTMNGISGVLLGLIAPICLFAGAAIVALGARARD
jgi:hypothetical protein